MTASTGHDGAGFSSKEDGGERLVRTRVTDDRGVDVAYAGYSAIDLVEEGYGIAHVVGLLWQGRLLSDLEAQMIERILSLSADHGPCVSGALASIMGARAGIPMAQSVASGLGMVGPRFGGAVSDAARCFRRAVEVGESSEAFVRRMKEAGQPIPGIGHRVKNVDNPDGRVSALTGFAQHAGLDHDHLDFATSVARITTAKHSKLILNLDGAIAAILLDMEFDPVSLNGFFVLARTIGLIGHWIDQTTQDARLFRLPAEYVMYDTPDLVPVPPIARVTR